MPVIKSDCMGMSRLFRQLRKAKRPIFICVPLEKRNAMWMRTIKLSLVYPEGKKKNMNYRFIIHTARVHVRKCYALGLCESYYTLNELEAVIENESFLLWNDYLSLLCTHEFSDFRKRVFFISASDTWKTRVWMEITRSRCHQCQKAATFHTMLNYKLSHVFLLIP